MPAKILKIILVINILLLDLVVLYFLVSGDLYNPQVKNSTNFNIPQMGNPTFVDECGVECKKYIDEKLKSPTLTIMPLSLTPTKTSTAQKTAIRRVSYVPIPGNGSTKESSAWVDLSGTEFYLNLSEFPGYEDSYFEANIKLTNGNGEAWVRIYDTTNSVVVPGSEVKTSSQKTTLVVSGKLNFRYGNNIYRIQARSLTADTTTYESGRIKIFYTN